MAKKPEHGMKAKWIREALTKSPDRSRKEMAEQLNAKAKREGYDLTFSATEISAAAGKLEKQSGKAQHTEKPKESAKLATSEKDETVELEQLRKLKEVVAKLGVAKTKELIDLLG